MVYTEVRFKENQRKDLFYMKKKTLLLFLSAVLACTALTGCGGKEEEVAPVVTDVSDATAEETEQEPEEDTEAPDRRRDQGR